VGVVPPEEVVGDDSPGWVEDGDRADQRERFIGLQV
jgi:hypothetical protein